MRTLAPTLPRLVLWTALLVGCEPKGTDLDEDGIPADVDCDDGDASIGESITAYTDADGDGFGGEEVEVDGCAPTDGLVAEGGDCDDAADTVFPGAIEACNGVDDDCDGTIDDGATSSDWFADDDGDGHGDPGDSIASCEAPEGYVASDDDCDDANDQVNPEAAESCNGVDDDCDGDLDEDGAVWYADTDQDGYGDAILDVTSCEAPEGAVDKAGDCDDSDAAYNPGAAEDDCTDPNDYNCDGSVGYTDGDGDGFAACEDCDDGDDAVSPGATELCNAIDDDCDGQVDGNDAADRATWYADLDGDGFGDAQDPGVLACEAPAGLVGAATDCDDGAFLVNPVGVEVCDADNVDEDCDGTADDADASATGQTAWYADADGDGFGDASGAAALACDALPQTVATHDDCRDTDPAYNPGAAEVDCADPNDYNCDGSSGYVDADGDGFAACEDCDDTNAAIHPGANEGVGDLVDQDCDGREICYADDDDDGYGTAATALSEDATCGAGLATVATDCDDADSGDHPDATEIVGNEDDEDCDGAEVCFVDADDDGHGVSLTAASPDATCGTKLATIADDCDDASADDYPGATEVVANGDDEDCDGGDLCYRDADGDGAGGASTTASADLTCVDPGEAASVTDCDDTDKGDHPGATETVGNGDDEDCDGADSCYVDADDDGYGVASVVDSTDLTCGAKLAAVAGDCDDVDADDHPGATETVGNGDDESCDGTELCFVDADKDGQGTTATVTESADAGLVCDTAAGESKNSDDCDDASAADYKGAVEIVGNNDDDNCDGVEVCYVDADGDTQGASTKATVNESADAGFTCDTASGEADDIDDCDDTDKGDYKGAVETVGNGDDESCDGAELCYADVDRDTYGSSVVIPESADAGLTCSTANGEANDNLDCNDASNVVYPGRTEIVADGVDQDCDLVDSCYVDGDKDGQGKNTVADSLDLDCTDSGESAVNTDCDDADAGDYKGATEIVGNNDDEDCDGTELCYLNTDGDAYGTSAIITESASDTDRTCEIAEGEGTKAGDCDDADKSDYPGATETVGNADDESCDGVELCYADTDQDGQGSTTVVNESADAGFTCDTANLESAVNTDCDDTDKGDHKGAVEVVGNGDDEDCDTRELCYVDNDQDGQGTASVITESTDAGLACDTANKESGVNTDCDDADKGDYKGATEVVGNGDDEDCDTFELCYIDLDGDTQGNANKSTVTESADAGWVCDTANGEANDFDDCDDTDKGDYKGAVEIIANADDESCDGIEICYVDTDKDTYGASSGATVNESGDAGFTCDAANGEADDTLDCDDKDAGDYPGATEIVANGDDEDCNGLEKCYQNLDNDPYGTSTLVDSTDLDCADSGEAAQVTDCDDADPRRYPGLEVCDGRQNDCASTWTTADEDGEVTLFPPTGTGFTSLTSAWAAGTASSPAAIRLPGAGTVNVCRGTWYVALSTTTGAGVLDVVGYYGATSTILSGGGVSRVLTVNTATADLDLIGLTLADGNATVGGGAYVQSAAWFGLTDSVLRDNTSGGRGGGLRADVDAQLTHVEVYDNVATTDGGGLAGNIYCAACDVHDNLAGNHGGGIWGTELVVNDSLIWGNVASGNGGGLAFAPAAPGLISTITSTEISGNDATNGGGMWAYGTSGSVSFAFADLLLNTADDGGGLYLSGIDGITSATTIDQNAAARGGGVFQIASADFSCSGNVSDAAGVQGNRASTSGGGVYRASTSGFTRSNTCDWGVGAADNNTPHDIWTSATSTASHYGDDATFNLP